MSVLVVAGVSRRRAVLADALLEVGFDVRVASTGEGALLACASSRPGLVVLDVADAFRVLQRIRASHGERPRALVVMWGPGELREAALLAGADDCVSRPYSVGEVVARAQAIMRRSAPQPAAAMESFDVGELRINAAGRQAWLSGRPLPLTGVEFALLLDLSSHAGIARSRDQLVESIWAQGGVGAQTVTVHVGRLRAKLANAGGPDHLVRSIRGVGYRLDAPAPSDGVTEELRLISEGSGSAQPLTRAPDSAQEA